MGKFSETAKKWWCGDPPMDEKVYETIHAEFNVLLLLGGLFLDSRPIKRIISSGIFIFQFGVCLSYLFLLSITAAMQRDDFVAATQTVHFAAIDFVALTCLLSTNFNRKHMQRCFATMSEGYFDYGDGFEIPEMKAEYKSTKKQKIIILVGIPTYLGITALSCMLRRTIDGYFGLISNELYENGVYMLSPAPVWCPFSIDSDFKHWVLVITQAMGAIAMALSISGSDGLFVLLCQSLSLQFKILIYRIRKINKCAYRLYRKKGGKKLTVKELYGDPDFMNIINLLLNKHAEHHSILIKQFHQMCRIFKWPGGIVLLFASLMIALSFLALVAGGGKPSMLWLASLLIVCEVSNVALICGYSEMVQELGESLHEELYNINWVDMDPSAKKSIMIMIQRSKISLKVMAGGLQPLNWESFSSIMNTAYSYVNLLLAADV